MDFKRKFQLLLKTRTFKIFLLLFLIYWIGFIYFFFTIYTDLTKTPGQNIFRDIVWIIYWRWNLDYIIVGTFLLIIIIETVFLSKLKRRTSEDFLSIYFSPIMNMAFAFLYMVAIDIGVTYFADTGFNANWTTPDILWFGMTAQQLYHNFFFWYIPAVIIASITNQVFIRTDSFTKTFRTFFILLAIYSLNLGFLDPVVCQILWNDWTIFGQWSMGGAEAMFAQGWIAHYIILACVWFYMDYVLKCSRHEIEFMVKPELTR